MAQIETLHDRSTIESFLRRDAYLHLYGLGDLDDPIWPSTVWYGAVSGGRLTNAVLVYGGEERPVVVALCGSHSVPQMSRLLADIRRLLPGEFYAHLSPGLIDSLGPARLIGQVDHFKMALLGPPPQVECHEAVVTLRPSDESELLRLYERSYPGNWFQPRMLQTGKYVGYRAGGQLVAVAGVHVYSRRYRVAALGNIATHPTHRGQGICRRLVACLCRDLRRDVDHVGLNVNCSNDWAIRSYKAAGFEVVSRYIECGITLLPHR